jgi:hypothetical protein
MRARTRDDVDVVMFAGPTLAASPRARRLARGLRLRRPVRRRDVEGLVASRRKPGVVVLVDGVFHDSLAVGHGEIRDALWRGWSVWGLSSMGAIRAREMVHLGVRGYGRVFERFCQGDDFQDDEVALLHEATSPYRAVSEPLLHLREAVAHLARGGLVADEDARVVIEDLKSRWYGERTVRGTIESLTSRAPKAAAAIRSELASFERFRTKTLDLERFLEERPWRAGVEVGC